MVSHVSESKKSGKKGSPLLGEGAVGEGGGPMTSRNKGAPRPTRSKRTGMGKNHVGGRRDDRC